MATGRVPTTANSPLTAKGDLFGYSTTQARVPVGNDGEQIVADSSTSTGLRWQGSQVAGKNVIINSAFDVWQRGTSLSGATANTYTADRWTAGRGGNALTISRQATNDTTNLPFIQYCARVQRPNADTGTVTASFVQTVETSNSIPYAGKTVTLSFYARAGANFSSASNVLSVLVDQGTGTDQSVWTPFTGTSRALDTTVTLTTTWQRFTKTFTFASTMTEFGPFFQYVPTGTAGAADYFEVTGVQLELGSVATAFARNGATIQGELGACQRYYYRITQATFNRPFGMGQAYSTTAAFAHINFPITMRIAPTALEQNGTAGDYRWVTAAFGATNLTGVVTFNTATENASIVTGVTGANLVAGNATNLQSTNGGAYLGWSAEL